jgi:hypothetical protein
MFVSSSQLFESCGANGSLIVGDKGKGRSPPATVHVTVKFTGQDIDYDKTRHV